VPGKSINSILELFLSFSSPDFLSTVTPGKFPTFWLRPVSKLNNVVFPQLGFPTNAIFDICFSLLF